MIDYLWGWQEADTELMCRALLDVRPEVDPASLHVREVGKGTLVTIGDAYPGFEPVETADELLVVLGGPKPVDGSQVRTGHEERRYSEWLVQRCKAGVQGLAFEVIGGFQLVKVNKRDGTIHIVTDAASFIPCYATDAFQDRRQSGVALCGSHADAVAQAAGLGQLIDAVSVADFLMYQTVTYPHTMYRHVHQLPPAQSMERRADSDLNTKSYWVPKEKTGYKSITEEAEELQRILVRNVRGVVNEETDATVLMSGGEDSRIVLCALPENTRKRAVTVTDFFNHEARVASKVSGKLGADWTLLKRTTSHYLDYAESSILLGESHNFFYHAHFNGFADEIGANGPVLGGLMADAFGKGSHISKSKKLGVESSINWDRWEYLGTPRVFDPGEDMKVRVLQRRNLHNECLKNLRPRNWAEWHSLYPATMNTNASNYFIDRRLFHTWEPFADSMSIAWSASVDPERKLNRRLFQRAVKPLLGRIWYYRHAKGTFPYFGWRLNGPLLWLLSYVEKVQKKYRAFFKISRANEGPWPVWRDVVSHEAFQRLATFQNEEHRESVRALLGEEIFNLVERSMKEKDPVQRLAGLQIRVWAGTVAKRREGYSATDGSGF